MAKIIMFVYGDIATDARVQRAASVVSYNNDLTLVSLKSDQSVATTKYKQEFVGRKQNGCIWLFDAIFSTINIVRKSKPDIVYCHDYYSSLLAYYLVLTNYSGKIVYDAHELIIPEDGITDRRLRFFYWFERKIVKKVDLLVCASQERGRIMVNHYGLEKDPIIIPNVSVLTVNNDINTQKYLNNLRHFFEIKKKTVVYAGVVSKGRRLELLLDAISKKTDYYKLLIVGGGAYLEDLKSLSVTYPSLDVCFTGALPYSCLGKILSMCDIGYLYYPTDTMNNIYCASNKVYEYASVVLPIVSNDNPTIKTFFDKYPIGCASDDLLYALELVGTKIEKMKTNCIKLNKENHWEMFSQRLRESIQRL